jgi:hypothetical protein
MIGALLMAAAVHAAPHVTIEGWREVPCSPRTAPLGASGVNIVYEGDIMLAEIDFRDPARSRQCFSRTVRHGEGPKRKAAPK